MLADAFEDGVVDAVEEIEIVNAQADIEEQDDFERHGAAGAGAFEEGDFLGDAVLAQFDVFGADLIHVLVFPDHVEAHQGEVGFGTDDEAGIFNGRLLGRRLDEGGEQEREDHGVNR